MRHPAHPPPPPNALSTKNLKAFRNSIQKSIANVQDKAALLHNGRRTRPSRRGANGDDTVTLIFIALNRVVIVGYGVGFSANEGIKA
ncbi:hypothetical protein EVAR_52182_1 [Eumeta japonica]|uniref:Uncharacterized protein n=1 Tax=Eumeta variegata TaxID=151549 RepID=A0A4C1YBK0_EUMVA|nr:hypothetical protein EVAR_52182_1 [Eumeta japonica]